MALSARMDPYSTEFLRLFNKEEAIHIQGGGYEVLSNRFHFVVVFCCGWLS